MGYFERKEIDVQSTLDKIRDIVNEEYISRKTRKKEEIIRLHNSTLGSEELIGFIECYLKGQITMGKINTEYESVVSKYFDIKHCLSNNSGSSANLLAIAGLVEIGKLKKGDKIIVPALSWSTTIYPLVQHGLIPVFVDQSDTDYNIDIERMTECANEINGIKAVMLIHTYGVPVEMERIMNMAKDNNWVVIEDTCESMGAEYRNKRVGTFGDVGTFSTYYSHHLCTLEGGLTITENEELASVMQSVRSHGWIRHRSDKEEIAKQLGKNDCDFLFQYSGYNLRMSEPQAAMGIEQFKKLDEFIKLRQENASHFLSGIEHKLNELSMPVYNQDCKPSWFGIPIIINNCCTERIMKIKQIMKKNQIEVRPFLAGNFATQPVMSKYKHIKYGKLEVAERIEECAMAIPCHQSLNKDDMHRIAKIISLALEETE